MSIDHMTGLGTFFIICLQIHARQILAIMYKSSPVYNAPSRLIGMKIFRVIGWQTKRAALIWPSPTNIRLIEFRWQYRKVFTKAIQKVQMKTGTNAHVKKFRLKT